MSLIARYQFDGNARDSEGSAHGTAFDVAWGRSQLVDGGGEARLNGTTSRIETGIQFTTEAAVTLAIWFRPRQGAGHLIGQHDGTNGLAIEQTETGKIRLVVGDTASAEVTVYPGEYHSAVVVYDAGEATLYLGGLEQVSLAGTVTWPAVPVTLGARADGMAPLELDMAGARAYSGAITLKAVRLLASDMNIDTEAAPNPGEPRLVDYTMDNISGSTLVDEAGNHDATVYGATQVAGIDGMALSFDGSNDYALVTGIPRLGKFTLAFIFTPDMPAGATGVALETTTNVNNNPSGFFFAFEDVGWAGFDAFYVNMKTNSTDYNIKMTRRETLMDGKPHLVIITFDNTVSSSDQLLLYIDDFQQAITPSDSKYRSHTSATAIMSPLYIGARAGNSAHTKMVIDQLFLCDFVITPEEARQLYFLTLGPEGMTFPLAFKRLQEQRISGAGFNPNAMAPRIPNSTAIPRSGRSEIVGASALLASPAWADQVDGSGGDHTTPLGRPADPARRGHIAGTTTDKDGFPVSRRVRCFERKSGRIVRETWSDAAGHYRFDDLDPAKRFTLVGHDYAGQWNAVIADNVHPEVT